VRKNEMTAKKQINYELKYPQGNVRTIELFHCHKCGYHPNALISGYQINTAEIIFTRVLSIYPHNTEIIETIIYCKHPIDCELIEIITCMNCKCVGEMVQVPRYFLENSGLAPRDNDSSICDSIKSSKKIPDLIKSILKKIGIIQ
jgi:hypothetical protein